MHGVTSMKEELAYRADDGDAFELREDGILVPAVYDQSEKHWVIVLYVEEVSSTLLIEPPSSSCLTAAPHLQETTHL
jgi:Zn-dependent M28 family amino/carboxypeptidase